MLLLTDSLLAPAVAQPEVTLPFRSDASLVFPVTSQSASTTTAHTEEVRCDEGGAGGSFVQDMQTFYGNRFEPQCSGRLTAVRFTHFGYGYDVPYRFRIHFFDASCQKLGSTSIREVPAAPQFGVTEEVDLSNLGWCAGDTFYLLLEPLTCKEPEQDCYPAVLVDATSDTNALSHCAVVNRDRGAGRECLSPQSPDGRYFDFLMRAVIECDPTSCTTSLESHSWGQTKILYR